MFAGRLLLAALACCVAASTNEASSRSTVNPIRRVVTMLQNMGKKIEAEGKKEEEQFEAFMCYCNNGGSTLEQSIIDAENKITQLESSIKETAANLAQLKADLKSHKEDRAAAKSDMEKATALRKKEAAAYAKFSSDADTNIAAMTKAIAALEKGAAGAFLQTSAANVIRKLAIDLDLSNGDRDDVLSFLSGGYAPQSGQITGILKQMNDVLAADLKTATGEEDTAKANYESLMQSKKKEVSLLSKSIETKTQRVGELSVKAAGRANDLEDTKESLAEDQKFLQDMEKNCKSKKDEWAVRQKLRAEEQLALADTIKILNDDDALELFKKTLPTPSLLQLTASNVALRRRARAVLESGSQQDARLGLISSALGGKKVNFDKVINMIDDMVKLLKEEQKADDEKKDYCNREFDASDDKKKQQEQAIADLETNIEDKKGAISALTTEIAALNQGIRELDKQVKEATEAREEAHATYVEELSANKAANELLGIAKNRLNKFYNPKLYKAPPKRQLSEEERITVNMGGTLAATAAPGGIAGTGVTAFAQDGAKPGPPPAMYGEYKKSSEESGGVIAMIDLLKADLEKDMTESKVDEEHDQAQYEKMMADAAEKRAADTKSRKTKEGEKADAEEALQTATEDKAATTKELAATMNYIKSLHVECDWLIKFFDVRKEARAGEIESLSNAKAVLNGADYSLVQEHRSLRGQ
jgi:outer membrane murein-binding lipoprotein Lpp